MEIGRKEYIDADKNKAVRKPPKVIRTASCA